MKVMFVVLGIGFAGYTCNNLYVLHTDPAAASGTLFAMIGMSGAAVAYQTLMYGLMVAISATAGGWSLIALLAPNSELGKSFDKMIEEQSKKNAEEKKREKAN